MKADENLMLTVYKVVANETYAINGGDNVIYGGLKLEPHLVYGQDPLQHLIEDLGASYDPIESLDLPDNLCLGDFYIVYAKNHSTDLRSGITDWEVGFDKVTEEEIENILEKQRSNNHKKIYDKFQSSQCIFDNETSHGT